MRDVITASQAKDKIEILIDETAKSHRPILITANNHNAVLLSEEDWNALQETLYLLSVPGIHKSVVAELKAPNEEFLSEKEFLSELEKENRN
ncbi:MAG: type II toxin-antitoxin system Phd/YefM family antitoxin [Acidobacteriota bacterium]|nr:type II toxin-antitoxin system Phd/YefM family antitoxin [Acidobacteriota bacterium]